MLKLGRYPPKKSSRATLSSLSTTSTAITKTFSSTELIISWQTLRNLRKKHKMLWLIERFHSRGQRLCKFNGTKKNVYIRKEFNSHRICLKHQHGRPFIVLEHQYGRFDVMWKRSILKVIKVKHRVATHQKVKNSLTFPWLFTDL